jgi:hypothetical protein
VTLAEQFQSVRYRSQSGNNALRSAALFSQKRQPCLATKHLPWPPLPSITTKEGFPLQHTASSTRRRVRTATRGWCFSGKAGHPSRAEIHRCAQALTDLAVLRAPLWLLYRGVFPVRHFSISREKSCKPQGPAPLPHRRRHPPEFSPPVHWHGQRPDAPAHEIFVFSNPETKRICRQV